MFRGLRLFIISLLCLIATQAEATHLVGGFLSYRYLGTNGTMNSYKVSLYVYRDCINDNTPNEVPFDENITLCVYTSNKRWYNSFNVKLLSKRKVDPVGNTSCPEVAKACLEQGIYETNVSLPASNGDYHLKWERCCRNTQNNLDDDVNGTPYQGQTYYGKIPASSLRNSSPYFLDVPVPFICINDTVTIRNRAVDPDGDSLSYKLVTPWQGASTSNPSIDNCYDPMSSFPTVDYTPGYSATQPFGSTGLAQIDGYNGLTTYLARKTGRYAIAIEVTEWRNKIPISTIRLDLQILVIDCKPNNKPRLSYQGGSTIWNVEAGAQICRDVTVIDDKDTKDVVTLKAYGDIFTGANGFTGNRASMNPATAAAVRTATSRFCWVTRCEDARPEPYRVTFEGYDNGCPSKFINENVLIYVKPFTALEQPTGPLTVCQSAQGVVYQAANADPNHTYRWRVSGGTIVGDSTKNKVTVDWGNGTSGSVSLWIISPYKCEIGPRTIAVVLRPAPAKPNISGNDTVCLNTSSNFTSSADPGVTYQWTASGGNILGSSTGNNVNVRWNTKGNGFVTLVVTNSTGCPSLPDTFFVFVSHPNTPPLEGPVSVCPNNRDITYAVNPATPGSVYKWFISGGVQGSGAMSPSITVNWGGLGIGWVKVIELNKFGCPGDTVSLRVVKNHALAGQLPIGDTSICEFTKGWNYSIKPVNGETYNWIVTGGTLVSGQGTDAIVVDWGAAGVGSVGVQSTAYDSISGLPCFSPVRARIVNIRPVPGPARINGNLELCQSPGDGAYTITGYPGSTYTWQVLGNTFSGQGTAIINLPLDTFGTFTLRVRETTQYGCVGPWNDTDVVIHPKPRTSGITGAATICWPRLTAYSYSVTGLPGSTYQWWIDQGTLSGNTTSNSVTADWSGQQNNTLKVVETSGFGCKGDTITLPVFIDNPSIDCRLVTVDPPPADDKKVFLYFNLLNAPRYNQPIVVQRRPRGSTGSFATIGSAAGTDFFYTDKTALTDSMSYEYRVVAVNLCGDSLISGTHTDILLKGQKTGPFSFRFTFTDYMGWANGVDRYELYRALEDKSGYALYKTYTAAGITDSFANGKDHFGQWYRIKAYEKNGIRESWSNDLRVYFEPVIFVPNAFTPDGNGLNDRFLPSSGGLKTYDLRIYNRWGEKVFETRNTELGWDGLYKEKPAQEGVYVWAVRYTDFRDKVYEAKGTLHLLR
ncbi:MAG: gliding motility-associated C-terminal domain-containing protein [Bacteroidetes bacterium]|nr:gliding motility-associated C-terminal domain-containing protein [Bacteroidota bacterium]